MRVREFFFQCHRLFTYRLKTLKTDNTRTYSMILQAFIFYTVENIAQRLNIVWKAIERLNIILYYIVHKTMNNVKKTIFVDKIQSIDSNSLCIIDRISTNTYRCSEVCKRAYCAHLNTNKSNYSRDCRPNAQSTMNKPSA